MYYAILLILFSYLICNLRDSNTIDVINTEYVQLIMMKIEDVSSSYLWVKYFMVVSNARLLERCALTTFLWKSTLP